jgi:hypothetical protein
MALVTVMMLQKPRHVMYILLDNLSRSEYSMHICDVPLEIQDKKRMEYSLSDQQLNAMNVHTLKAMRAAFRVTVNRITKVVRAKEARLERQAVATYIREHRARIRAGTVELEDQAAARSPIIEKPTPTVEQLFAQNALETQVAKAPFYARIPGVPPISDPDNHHPTWCSYDDGEYSEQGWMFDRDGNPLYEMEEPAPSDGGD